MPKVFREEIQGYLSDVDAEIKRCVSIIEHIRNFSKNGFHKKVSKNVTDVILKTGGLICKNGFSKSVLLNKNLSTFPQFHKDQVKIRQVLLNILKNAVELEGILEEGYEESIKAMDPSSEIYFGIVAKSPEIKKVIQTIQKVKDSTLPVLICGENGVGKELVARYLHYASKRNKYPFVAVNCVSLKLDLLENAFFGHTKGAFTGSTNAKNGIISLANKGTLFIDGISDMNPHVQASLLRFIENGIFRPKGSLLEQKIEVRIVMAVNHNIEKEVEEKRFSHDLYSILNSCRIDIPPLRSRKKDIPVLIDYFLSSKISAAKNKITITPDALELLVHYHWPGNVRELFHVVDRAILILENSFTITAKIIKSVLSSQNLNHPNLLSGISLKSVEKKSILDNLKANNWNVSRTAEILGIDRRTLHRKINRYKLRKTSPAVN
tara:strand:+ start:3588 stop:4895 length:1308 start_codon:yes stop_codon:yes gene_type:complete